MSPSSPGMRLRAAWAASSQLCGHRTRTPPSIPLRLQACSLPAIRDSIPMAWPRPTTTSCPGWALPRTSLAMAKPAFAAAPASSLTAASTAPCSTSTPTWRRSLHPSFAIQRQHLRNELRRSVRKLQESPTPSGSASRQPSSALRSQRSQSWLTYDPYKGFKDPLDLRLEPGCGAANDEQSLVARSLCCRA